VTRKMAGAVALCFPRALSEFGATTRQMQTRGRQRVNRRGSILIITGARELGKTTLCTRLAEASHSVGWTAAGLLSPARFVDGKKVGIEAEDVSTRQRFLLARLRTGSAAPTDPGTDRWSFDPRVLAWGNAVLQKAVPCDLLVVDELGPLELERQQGWIAGLTAIDSKSYQCAVVVVRPELLEKACTYWPSAQVFRLEPNAPAGTVLAQLTEQILSGRNSNA